MIAAAVRTRGTQNELFLGAGLNRIGAVIIDRYGRASPYE
jgi:hypothetical protein